MAEIKKISFKIVKGMQQDLDYQTSDNGAAFALFNIKTLVGEDSITNSLVNEKGNTEVPIEVTNKELIPALETALRQDAIKGTVIGVIQCDTNTVVIFTHHSGYTTFNWTLDIIYKLTYANSNGEEKILATIMAYKWGSLLGELIENLDVLEDLAFNFSYNNLISGLFVYENSEIQKVYWVDGRNLLRFLNIAARDNSQVVPITDVEKLNSSPSFKVDHHFEAKRVSGTGRFPSGVILYCFTYYNKYGAETNIVDMTPLYYISDNDKGIAADENKSCAYEISLQNPDTSFDYARVYSIIRTSYNGEPIVKVVGDIKLK